MTHKAFQRACQLIINNEQESIRPDNALVKVLCEAVRCSRECCEIAGGSESKVAIDILKSQLRESVGELGKFREAMEREKSPKWSEHLKSLADTLDSIAVEKSELSFEQATNELQESVRQFRYMANSFTLKANRRDQKARLRREPSVRDAASTALGRYIQLHKTALEKCKVALESCRFVNTKEWIEDKDGKQQTTVVYQFFHSINVSDALRHINSLSEK